MKCEALSASRATTYEGCPLRYYSRYELGIKGSGTLATDGGQLGHEALEIYYTPNCTMTADEAFNLSQSKNSCADKEEFECIKKMFFDYVNAHPRENYAIIGAEVELRFATESGATFLGYIDRLDLVDAETIRVLDYKTGRFVPPYSELEEAHQTNLYPLWIYRNPDFKGINHIVFEYHYTRTGEEKQIYVSRDTAFQYQEYAEHLFHSIINDDAPEPRLNGFCYNCDYRGECPAYKNLIKAVFQDGNITFPSGATLDQIKQGTFEEIVMAYDLLGIAERSIKNEKKQLGSMVTNALKYSHLEGAIVGDRKVKLQTRANKKCNKMAIRRLAKKYKVEDEVLKEVSLNSLEEAFRSNPEALRELSEVSRVEQSRPFPSITKLRSK